MTSLCQSASHIARINSIFAYMYSIFSCMYSFIHSIFRSSIIQLFIFLFIYFYDYIFIYKLIQSSIHLFFNWCILFIQHQFSQTFIHSLSHSSVHLFNHSSIHSFIYSIIHPFTRSFMHSSVHLFFRKQRPSVSPEKIFSPPAFNPETSYICEVTEPVNRLN